MGENQFERLTEEREGYVMRNEKDGVEISCTEKFVDAWKQRGFIVVREGTIKLVDSSEPE